VHPFEKEGPEVQTIYYEGGKTISKRMHRLATHPKHHEGVSSRALGKHGDYESSQSYLDSLINYVWPSYGQSSYKLADMTNLYNLSYLGEIYVGTASQSFLVIWDTGSGSFLCRSTYCDGCPSATRKFNYASSTTWVKQSPQTEKTVTYMDGTQLKGYYGTDRVCPTSSDNSCADNFKFTAIHTATGLRDYEDGIIGLWSGNTLNSLYDDATMFMPKMTADSTITQKVFSWYMTGQSGKSYIDFGAPNTAVYSSPSSLFWIDILSDDYWWTNRVTGVRWSSGVPDTSTEYKYSSKKGLTDTGSSCLIGPKAEVDYFKNTILNTISGVTSHSGWGTQFDCSDANIATLPTFELLFGGYWFEVKPEDYIIEFNSSTKKCSVCFSGYSTIDYWILGDAFMRGLYSIHDYDNLRMGFVPFVGSTKKVPVKATTTPTTTPPVVALNLDTTIFGLTVGEFLIIAVLVVIIVGIVVLLFLFCYA